MPRKSALPVTRSPVLQPVSARCRNGTWPTFMPGPTIPAVNRDLDRADAESLAFERGLQGQARRAGASSRCRTGARRGGQALRAARRSARPADLLCRARPCRQHDRSRAREILCRRAGADHRRLHASAVLRARAQPARRRRSSKRPCRIRRSAITGRGSKISARTSPISSRTASSSCSTRSR